MQEVDTLGTALSAEIKRIIETVIPTYLELGIAGKPALLLMQREIDFAMEAMMEGDVVNMLSAYNALKVWQL